MPKRRKNVSNKEFQSLKSFLTSQTIPESQQLELINKILDEQHFLNHEHAALKTIELLKLFLEYEITILYTDINFRNEVIWKINGVSEEVDFLNISKLTKNLLLRYIDLVRDKYDLPTN